MDYSAIHAAITSLKAATDISTTLLSMKVTGEVQGKVIELQSALLGAQNAALAATTAQFELQERIRQLEARLNERADWDHLKNRYRLVNPWKGPAQAYALSRESANGEKAHLACTTCFHRREIVILTPQSRSGWVVMVCPVCKASMETGWRGIGAPSYAEDYEAKAGER